MPIKTLLSKKSIPLILSAVVIVGLALFFLAKQGISQEELLAAIRRFSPLALLAVFGCGFAQVFFMIARVWVLFPRSNRLGFRRVAEGMAFGQFLNTFAPARAGDVDKALVFSRGDANGVTFLTGVGVLVADRFVDILALLAVLGLSGAYLAPGVRIAPRISAWWLGVIPILLVGLALLYRWFARRYATRIQEWLGHFRLGFAVLGHPRQLFAGVLLGMVGWAFEVAALQILCNSQGLWLKIDQAVFVLFALNLAIAIPISLANVGPFEAAIVFALKLYGMRVPDAIAVATVHHWGQYGGIGAWALLMASVKRLRPEQPEAPKETFEAELQEKMHAIAKAEQAAGSGVLRVPPERERRAILELAHLGDASGKLLDLGCGTGFYALEAKRAGLAVHAVDSQPGRVLRLHGQVDEIEVADLESFESESRYDRVICTGVLDTVAHPEKAFASLCRLVAPGGRLVILVPRQNLPGWIHRIGQACLGQRVNLYSEEWLADGARRHGMRVAGSARPDAAHLAMAFTCTGAPK